MELRSLMSARKLLLGMAWLVALLPLPGLATEACDRAGFETVLQPLAGPAIEAQAYWLDRRLLQWPGHAGATYRLHVSKQAALQFIVGQAIVGADFSLPLDRVDIPQPGKFKFIGDGVRLSLRAADLRRLPDLHKSQMLLVEEGPDGKALAATRLQAAGAIDDLYAAAEQVTDLGVSLRKPGTQFKLWAPSAQKVSLCRYATGHGAALAEEAMAFDPLTGIWAKRSAADLSGQYYSYLVDVFVPGVGLVRNQVTDPYSVSLTTDSKRSYIADLASAALKPKGWDASQRPQRVKHATDMVIYELHLRDFSISDPSVPESKRGKYAAFTETGSKGMQHLQALSAAGLTDVHLLPVFDIATIPEAGCTRPEVPRSAADSEAQQAAVMAQAATDCFNWGYDPFHFNAPEGSYSSNAADAGARIIEFRQMVQALHRADLRVGMDVVYNHMTASGQQQKSVLDRIVPGYYHRLDAKGAVERSTCCDNTATEHRMMAKLMIDSVVLWAGHYKIDSFRFDLMGHQPRVAMEALQQRVNAAAGRPVQLIGEGWNFGEIANGARFVQASQLSLNGSGIGTFSDRGRDAARGGSAGDSGADLVSKQGWLNGLVYDPNALAGQRPQSELLQAADMIRVGLAGSLRGYKMLNWQGQDLRLDQIAYGDQPAGYVSQPGEVVNYVDNHDNQTLFDINVLKLPQATSAEDRARVQMLGAALTAFSQGIAYFHAGIDLLRSKSLDRNSFDSGDWFNRLDWSYRDNFFGIGLPPKGDNGDQYLRLKPLLADPAIKPGPLDIAWTRDMFRDLLRIRASTRLLRMDRADDIQQRLKFLNVGKSQNPVVIAAAIDGDGYAGAGFKKLLYFINVDKAAQSLTLPSEAGLGYQLHPVHLRPDAADQRPALQAQYDTASGKFSLPARTALVFVLR